MLVFVLVYITFSSLTHYICNHFDEDERAGCFHCFLDVLLLYMSCCSSSRCRRLVCSLCLVFPDNTHLLFVKLKSTPEQI